MSLLNGRARPARWTPEREALFAKLWDGGAPGWKIAEAVGISPGSVSATAYDLRQRGVVLASRQRHRTGHRRTSWRFAAYLTPQPEPAVEGSMLAPAVLMDKDGKVFGEMSPYTRERILFPVEA